MQTNIIYANKIKNLIGVGLAIAVLFVLQTAFAPKAQATTYNVNTVTTGPGGCGLVEAIAEVANPGAASDCAESDGTDVINIAAGTYDLSALPAVAIDIPGTSLTINGAAAKTTILDGGDTAAGLNVNAAGGTGNIFVNNLTIQNFSAMGFLTTIITVIDGTSVFNNLIITDNVCPGDTGPSCSIFVAPQATISNSAIFNNQSAILITAGNAGGPSNTNLNVFNNTFFNNTGTVLQIINYAESTTATVNFVNNTVVKNIATLGAAFAVDASPGSGAGSSILNLKNNIFLNNTIDTEGGALSTCIIGSETGVIDSLGGNIADDATCTSFGANDLSNTAAQIASALESVGDTYVLPITNTSQAYNFAQAGGTGGLTTPSIDQRGVARPQNGAYDSGAYEYVTSTPGLPNTGTTNSKMSLNIVLIILSSIAASGLVVAGLALNKRK